jgi:hypothetical protein
MKKKSAKKPARKKMSTADLKKFNGGRPESCWQTLYIEIDETIYGLSATAAENYAKTHGQR